VTPHFYVSRFTFHDLMDKGRKTLDDLVTAVTNTTKYAHVSPDLVRQVGEQELAIRRSFKEAVKTTKNKLHQVGGAYFEARLDYPAMLAQLRQAADEPARLRAACLDLMRRHASTRERLPILDEFYTTTLGHLENIRVINDLACGLNPLAIPWLPFTSPFEYRAYDIYTDMMAFVAEVMALLGVNGRAQTGNLINQPPTEHTDLSLILKTLPVLEQVEKGAASRLLDALNSRYLLITFPVQSLGGRSKGMVQTYEAQFMDWVAGRNWQIQRFEFPTELAFLVQTGA
jgi:16S rRNA (guanine(1405)-N(7))-methyltransferase